MEMSLRGRISSIKSCKLHYVVTDRRIKFTISVFLRKEIKSDKELGNIRVGYSYYDRKLKVESWSQQQTTNDCESYIGPVSRLYLAKEEDRKGIVTHILEECFAQFYLY